MVVLVGVDVKVVDVDGFVVRAVDVGAEVIEVSNDDAVDIS